MRGVAACLVPRGPLGLVSGSAMNSVDPFHVNTGPGYFMEIAGVRLRWIRVSPPQCLVEAGHFHHRRGSLRHVQQNFAVELLDG